MKHEMLKALFMLMKNQALIMSSLSSLLDRDNYQEAKIMREATTKLLEKLDGSWKND